MTTDPLLAIPLQRPHGKDGLIATFGDPKVRMVQGVWVVDQKWEEENLTFFRHPVLPARVYLHRLVIAPFARLCNRWEARILAGDPYRVSHLSFFCPRLKRGLGDPSVHSWAVAFDLNPATNPLIVDCLPDDPRRRQPFDPKALTGHDIPDAWFDDARQEGWDLGLEFSRRCDAMHMQFVDGY